MAKSRKSPAAAASPRPRPAQSTRPAAPAPTYQQLVDLFGKPVDDPAVTALLAGIDGVQIKPDSVIAKQAGFEFGLERPAGTRPSAKKLLCTLFLYPDRDDGRGFADLPAGFAFTTRDALLAGLPAPDLTWDFDRGKVDISHPDPGYDRWIRDGLEVDAYYQEGVVTSLVVSLPVDAMGGRDLSIDPLHFQTRPSDAPPGAELVGMALLVAWAADRFGLPAKHAASEVGRKLAARAITPREFLVAACDSTLATLDVDPRLGDFLYKYVHHLVASDDDGPRSADDAAIAQLLGLERDERCYGHDFIATFAGVVDSPFHIPASWDAVDRLATVLDARWADFQATGFRTPPDLAIYRTAVEQRDAYSVVAARIERPPATADASLATDLVALIDRPLSDPQVKAVLARAGMPVGKRIDQQANPALGVSYMGTKLEIAGKRVLGIDTIWFFAARQRRYIRGIGAEVEFDGYPGPLPHGLALGASRAEVVRALAALGAPARSQDNYDMWQPAADRILACEYAGDQLTVVKFGKPLAS